MKLNLKLDFLPSRFLWLQLSAILGLLLISFISYLYRYSDLGRSQSFGLWLFYVDAEESIVTWYSAALLLLCAALSAIAAYIHVKNQERYIRHWQVLALIFLFLSVDETISIHEKLISPLRAMFKTGGLLYFAWVVVAIPLVAIFVMVYWRFLAHLPRKTQRLVWLSGFTYVAGAVGCEMIGGAIAEAYGTTGIFYAISVHFEEGLELLGLTIFLYGLLGYISSYIPSVVIMLNSSSQLQNLREYKRRHFLADAVPPPSVRK